MSTNSEKLNNTVTVYIATFADDVVVKKVAPTLRNDYLERYSDRLTQQQSYCVWMLLDCALRDCYGYGVEQLDCTVSDNGKWSCSNGVFFSLSHCNNVVAVALSSNAVGVDIEAVVNFRRYIDDKCFVQRVLTDSEQLKLHSAPVDKAESLATMWTQKESIFKMGNSATFVPKSIDTTTQTSYSQLVTVNGEQYVLSVASYVPVTIQLKQADI
ncbi:MAG: 4'-phosphopantetheinyl transferase superfamily protein [Clostridiales bacterium]|nr:4'-phosphopantetheinyl transferase superfamily protein [Clostridiales bacterium]